MGASPVARIENPSRQIRLNVPLILFLSKIENSCRQLTTRARISALALQPVARSVGIRIPDGADRGGAECRIAHRLT
jgi:hypothetical protein